MAQDGTILTLGHKDVSNESLGRPSFDPAGCTAVTAMLGRVGDKWSMQIVMVLSSGKCRFSELKRRMDGISQRMLTLSLRNLERDGLVTRTVFPTIPPRVDYALTPLGESLRVPVAALGQWIVANHVAMESARARFDAAAEASKEA